MSANSYHTIREAVTDGRFLQALRERLPYNQNIGQDDLCQEVVFQGLKAEQLGNFKLDRGSPMNYLLQIARHICCRESTRAGLFRAFQSKSPRSDRLPPPVKALIREEAVYAIQRQVAHFTPEDIALINESDDPEAKQARPRTSRERTRKFRMIREIRSAIPDWETWRNDVM